jgi:hypothetical protein
MCKLLFEKTSIKIGYKVLVKKQDKFYSSYTGQEIKIGKIPNIPKYAKVLTKFWNIWHEHAKFNKLPHFKSEIVGKSSSFIDLNDAENMCKSMSAYHIRKGYTCCVCKVEYDSENVLLGQYLISTENRFADTILGDSISLIEEIVL